MEKESYCIKKYNGDDIYSYAVFRKGDVKNLRPPIFYGQASPIVCSLSRAEALSHKRNLELRAKE